MDIDKKSDHNFYYKFMFCPRIVFYGATVDNVILDTFLHY